MNGEPVLLSAIIFSDYKIRDLDSGKLALIGIFQRFLATQIPFTSPPFFATAFITNIRGKIENLPVLINIENAVGDIISRAEGQISSAAEISLRDVAEISFPIPPTEFVTGGYFKAVVLIDGEQIGHRTFNVVG